MNVYTVNSKIAARTFALALAVEIRSSLLRGNSKYSPNGTVLEQAKDFEKYLIGDANLPEVPEDPTKSWVETLKEIYEKQSKEDSEKRDRDWKEFLNTLPKPEIKPEGDEANKPKL